MAGQGTGAVPTAKTYRLGTHRVLPPEITLSHLLPRAGELGVSRLANVTGLDYVGITVVMAVRPNSRGLSVHQGKGATLVAAKVSALMEALEWWSAEAPVGERVLAGAAALGTAAIALPDHVWREGVRTGEPMPWLAARDAFDGSSCFVPEELVTTDFTLPHRPGFGRLRPSSNGLGAGNTEAEATLHAVCELVERDAFALWRQAPASMRAATRIDPWAMPDAAVADLMARLDAAGMMVEAWDITSDLGVPCFHAVIDDRRGRAPFLGRFGGVGCHPSAGVALARALAEAAQSRVTFISGARDDIARESYSLVGQLRSLTSMIIAEAPPPPTGVAARAAVSFDTSSVESDLQTTLERLARSAVGRVAVVDLTPSELGTPCVRVVAAGLEGMAHKPGYRPGKRALAAARRWS